MFDKIYVSRDVGFVDWGISGIPIIFLSGALVVTVD